MASPLTVYATAGDGMVRGRAATWAGADTTGESHDDTGNNVGVYSWKNGAGGTDWLRARGFFAFDAEAAGLPADATITGAVVSLYGNAVAEDTTIVQGSQASATALENTDVNAHGSVEFATHKTWADGYNDFTLNAAGLAYVNANKALMKFCQMEYTYDFLDTPPADTTNHALYVYTTKWADTTRDPKIVITYTTPPRTYYVDSVDGDDGAAGTSWATAWATVAKVNATTLAPGDTVLFGNNAMHRGEIAAQEGIVYDRHPVAGSPAKALVLGSLDLSATADWTLHAAGVYETTATHATEIGNLVFDYEASCGVKRFTLGALANQGDFFYDAAADLIYLKSATDPGTFYSHIEAVQDITGFLVLATSDCGATNLDFRYGVHGALVRGYPTVCDGVTIEGCDVSYAGGCEIGSTGERYGGGISGARSVTNLIVRGCRVDNCYDQGLSQQEQAEGDTVSDQLWTDNIVTNCECGWEFFGDGGDVDNIVVDGNHFSNIGGGWGHAQRPAAVAPEVTTAYGVRFAHLGGGVCTNCAFTNNTIRSLGSLGVVDTMPGDGAWGPSTIAGWDIDHNTYYPDSATAFFSWSGNSTPPYGTHRTFAQWQTKSGVDADSEISSGSLSAGAIAYIRPAWL